MVTVNFKTVKGEQFNLELDENSTVRLIVNDQSGLRP